MHHRLVVTSMYIRTRGKLASGDVPSVLERLTSFPTALPVSLQLSLLRYLFAMPLQCLHDVPLWRSLLLELPYCRWSFPDFHGASQSSLEFPSLLWSSPVFAGVTPCPPELLLVCRSSSLSAGVPATSLEPLSLRVLRRFFAKLPLSSKSFPVVSYDTAIVS